MTSLQSFFLLMAAVVGLFAGMSTKGPPGLMAFVSATLKALGCAVGGVMAWMLVLMLGNLALGGDPARMQNEWTGALAFVLYTGLMAAALGFAPAAVGAGLGLGLRAALNRLPQPAKPQPWTPTEKPEE